MDMNMRTMKMMTVKDYAGRDVMTFECPVDREFHKGLITTRDYYFDE